jgi:hypothetical protein
MAQHIEENLEPRVGDSREKASVASTPVSVDIDPEAERRLLKKLDWVLLPLFTAICKSPPRIAAPRLIYRSQTVVTSSIGEFPAK